MTLNQVATIMLITSLLLTLFALRKAVKRGDYWHDAWVRDCSRNLIDRCELDYWKRNATLRDPKTGRYVKKVKPS
jgi:hypothetical protein